MPGWSQICHMIAFTSSILLTGKHCSFYPESNSPYMDAISTQSLFWPSTPRTYTGTCKSFSSVSFISKRELIYNFSSYFHRIYIFSGECQAIWAEVRLITFFYLPPPSLYFPLHLAQGEWTVNICPVDQLWSCSTSKNFPAGSLSGLILNCDTIVHSFICFCFYWFTQHTCKCLLCLSHYS